MNRNITIHKCNKNTLGQAQNNTADKILILSTSYEDRCAAAVQCFKDGYHSDDTLIFYNEEFINRGNTKNNLKKITSTVKNITHRFEETKTSLSNYTNIISVFHNYITKHEIKLEGTAVTIDISTFPRQELLLLLRYIKMLNSGGIIRILYTRPKKYGKWQSKGFKSVITVPSFSGTQIPGRKKLLVILAGFEEERMLKLWEEHEPSKTILVIGNPPTGKNFLRINKMKSRMMLSRANVIEEQAPANDPFAFSDAMEKTLKEYKRDYNIFIAPMNTKIQTVGLFLLSEKYNWFQITLATPNDYNVVDYSIGAEETYEFYI